MMVYHRKASVKLGNSYVLNGKFKVSITPLPVG